MLTPMIDVQFRKQAIIWTRHDKYATIQVQIHFNTIKVEFGRFFLLGHVNVTNVLSYNRQRFLFNTVKIFEAKPDIKKNVFLIKIEKNVFLSSKVFVPCSAGDDSFQKFRNHRKMQFSGAVKQFELHGNNASQVFYRFCFANSCWPFNRRIQMMLKC